MIHLTTLPIKSNSDRVLFDLNEEFIAVSSNQKHASVWTIKETNFLEPLILEGHSHSLTALLFGCTSDEDKILITASTDYIIQWNTDAIRYALFQNGHKVRGQVIYNSAGSVNHISLNSSTDLLATCIDKNIHIYDIKEKRHVATLEGHDSLVTAAEFSPFYDSTLVSISLDRTFKVWGLSSLSLLYQSSIISSSPFLSLAFNPMHNSVAIGTADGLIRIYDLTDGNGFIQMSKIDIEKLLKQNFYSNKADSKTADKSPRIINSKSNQSMKNSLIDSAADEDDDEENAQVGCSIIKMQFINQDLTCNNKKSTDIRDILEIDRIGLLVVTSGAILKLDFNNLNINFCFQFKDVMTTINNCPIIIGATSNASICRTNINNTIYSAVEKLFSNEVHLISLQAFDDLIQTSRSLSPTASWLKPIASQTSISVLSSVSLDNNSPLRSQLILKVSKPDDADKKKTNKAKNSTNNNKNLLCNQPVTFHSKIKSTGYVSSSIKSTSKVLKSKDTQKKSIDDSINLTLNYGKILNFDNQISLAEKAIPSTSIKIENRGEKLACCLNDGQIVILNCTNNNLKIKSTLQTSNAAINSFNWSSSGNNLIVASEDKNVYMFSLSNPTPLLQIHQIDGNMDNNESNIKKQMFTNSIKHVQFYYMDQFFIIAYEKKFYLYKYYIDTSKSDLKRYLDNSKYKLVKSFDSNCNQTLTALSAINTFYSYIILSVGSNKSIEVYDLNKAVHCLSINDIHTKTPHALIQNSSSNFENSAGYDLFLTAAMGDCIKLWDLRSASCVQRFEGHINKIHQCGLAFSPCGKYIATGSEDKNICIYDIRQSSFLHKLSGNSEVVLDVEFHCKQSRLFSCTLDGKIRTYST